MLSDPVSSNKNTLMPVEANFFAATVVLSVAGSIIIALGLLLHFCAGVGTVGMASLVGAGCALIFSSVMIECCKNRAPISPPPSPRAIKPL